jgi:DegV family protein with EDD domain
MRKVVISSDSGSILPERAREYGFAMIPCPIIMNGRTYLDTEIDMDEVYARLEAKENMPTTSTANVGEFAQFFTELSQQAEDILHISMSSVFSGHHNTALQGKKLAEEKLPGKRIEVVDSLCVGTGVALVAMAAAKAAAQSKNIDEIIELVSGIIPQVGLLLARDTLFYQAEGGRIFEARTWAEAESATSFRSITEADASTGGALKPVARAKTVAQIMNKLVEITKERSRGKKLLAVIGHTRAPDRAEKLKEMLLSQLDFDWLCVSDESASVVIHGGIGLIDYAFCPKFD